MKLFVVGCSFILFVNTFLFAIEADVPYRKNASSTSTYGPGEFLEYDISYGFYTAAYASLSVSDSIILGIKTDHVVAYAETKGFSDYLFSIRDRYESFINPITNLPILSIRSLKEGRYRHYNEVTYDRKKSTAFSLKSGMHSIPANIQDILSMFYYARQYDFNDNLTIDQLLTFRSFFSDKIFELIVKYRGIETVITKAGVFSCYKFTLCERKGDVLEIQDNMNFWITRDLNRIPVKVEFAIAFGSFVVELQKYSGLRNLINTY